MVSMLFKWLLIIGGFVFLIIFEVFVKYFLEVREREFEGDIRRDGGVLDMVVFRNIRVVEARCGI